jgi:hypothetical protein
LSRNFERDRRGCPQNQRQAKGQQLRWAFHQHTSSIEGKGSHCGNCNADAMMEALFPGSQK